MSAVDAGGAECIQLVTSAANIRKDQMAARVFMAGWAWLRRNLALDSTTGNPDKV